MSKAPLKTAYNLLELLDYSLALSNSDQKTILPLEGIREIITQVKQIVGSNCTMQGAHTQNGSRNGSALEGLLSYSSQNLREPEEVDFDRTEPENISLEKVSFNGMPRVRTVPPEVRGKIRELVGIEAEEVS